MRDPTERSRLAMHDILDSIEVAKSAIRGLDFHGFQQSPINRLAGERCVEIISEASRRISEDLRRTEPTVPWPKVAGIGNILRHNYQDVSALAIWNVLQNDLDFARRGSTQNSRRDRRRPMNGLHATVLVG
jgi:uncharacterized protein with HEPN domain